MGMEDEEDVGGNEGRSGDEGGGSNEDMDVDEIGGAAGGADEDMDVDEDGSAAVDADANHANPSIGPVALRRLMPIRDHHLPHLVDRLPH